MSAHGGTRKGAGRPLKWDIFDVCDVGQACENKLKLEHKVIADAKNEELYVRTSEFQYFWEFARIVPVSWRAKWLRSRGGQTHLSDIEAERSFLEREAKSIKFRTLPPGTRRRIIQDVAAQKGLPTKTVDNLWQAYRRFEKELRAEPYPDKT